MPPSKASRATAAHDDPEPKAANSKEKNGHGHGHGHGHANGKMRRVASSTGSNLKDVTNAANLPEPVAEQAASSAPAPNPTIPWNTFDRDFLHRYRREYHLSTPTAYASDYRSWVLTQSGSIGLFSPTISKKRESRRQTKHQLTSTVRKHFNSQGVTENDAIVDFLHRVRRGRLSKATGLPKMEKKMTDQERI